MRRLMLLTALTLPLFAQAPRKSVRAWFADGTGIEIYTETTGPTRSESINPGGMIGISYDRINRLIVDKSDNVLFGYYLDGKSSTVADAESIRISPISLTEFPNLFPRFKIPAGTLPTVDTVREFPAVKIGQVVTLDILFNPSTGERIYEVIRPLTEPSPASAPHHPVVTGGGMGEQLSLKEITLRVNGRVVDAPASWMLGTAARIDIPGHGTFIVSAVDPSKPMFHPVAQANGQSLSWKVDGDGIEITSKTYVLPRSEAGPIWIYHDPSYRSADSPNTVGLRTADSVDWLLPKR